jgi:hypothetical protein
MSVVAYVVSAHGFGHAARASAVMAALARFRRDLRLEIFTTVPSWFFAQSLDADHVVHPVETDLGLVQRSALEVDLEATVHRLDSLLAPRSSELARLHEAVGAVSASVVVCDIAPLGLLVASRLGIPAALVENFTWDWIWEGFVEDEPRLRGPTVRVRQLFDLARLHVQAIPVCRPVASALQVSPISRLPRAARGRVRRRLGVVGSERLALLSMGGTGFSYRSLDRLRGVPGWRFVVPGAGDEPRSEGRLVTLPFRSEFYHPDLVHASDVVVGKLGYSTVAEAFHAGCPMVMLRRPGFRESPVLARFAERELAAVEVTEEAFNDGSWIAALEEIEGDRRVEPRSNGAEAAATAILQLLDSGR